MKRDRASGVGGEKHQWEEARIYTISLFQLCTILDCSMTVYISIPVYNLRSALPLSNVLLRKIIAVPPIEKTGRLTSRDFALLRHKGQCRRPVDYMQLLEPRFLQSGDVTLGDWASQPQARSAAKIHQ